MSRYEAMFSRLSQNGEGAFIPFTVVGYPSLAQTISLVDVMASAGADGLEVGFPFSDPVADGPVIQTANNHALATADTMADRWECLAHIRARHPDLPIGLLTYANLLWRKGLAEFYGKAAEAGVDSVLVADAPVREMARFRAAAEGTGVATVCVAPPNASPATIRAIAEMSQGYTYVQGRAGVTGADRAMNSPTEGLIAALAEYGAPPSVIGFGVSTPDHVRQALASGAAGAISGSAVVSHIRDLTDSPEQDTTALAAWLSEMKDATRP